MAAARRRKAPPPDLVHILTRSTSGPLFPRNKSFDSIEELAYTPAAEHCSVTLLTPTKEGSLCARF